MSLSGDELWANTLSLLQPQLEKVIFEMWLSATTVEAYNGAEIVVQVPTPVALSHIRDNLAPLINHSLTMLAGSHVTATFTLRSTTPSAQSAPVPFAAVAGTDMASTPDETAPLPPANRRVSFNPRYTFETFVIGDRNKLAHAASIAVAERPGQSYNPLFLYGGVGLGKTHLLHAIAQHASVRMPSANIIYITTETFVREFVSALQSRTIDDFRNVYRTADFLLIDDIQFISGKESTAEEFFHTFNTLHNERKQIVITSDRPPHEISDLEDRLRSRFSGGLMIDIKPPEFETRVAILRRKARAEGIEVPDEALHLIASSIENNVRELEGAFIRVVAYSSLMNRDIDAQLAQEALEGLLHGDGAQSITVSDIVKIVCDHFQISTSDLLGRSRARDLVYPRQLAIYLARDLTGLSLPKLGKSFGGRDHTTILHACDKIDQKRRTDSQLQRQIRHLRSALGVD